MSQTKAQSLWNARKNPYSKTSMDSQADFAMATSSDNFSNNPHVQQFNQIDLKLKEKFKVQDLHAFARDKNAKYKHKDHFYLSHYLRSAKKLRKDKLSYWIFPKREWFLASFMVIISSYAIYFMTNLKHTRKRVVIPLWSWLVVFGIMFSGYLMFFFATIDHVIFNRIKRLITVKTYNGCFKESETINFDSIEDVQVVK